MKGLLAILASVLSIGICFFSIQVHAQSEASNPTEASTRSKTSVRKVQEVNFAEMNLKGTLRNPDGAFLVQKRGIRFLPLYDVQKNLDEKIRESSDFVR